MKLRVFTISEIVRVKDQRHAALMCRSFIRAVGLRRLVEIAGDVHIGHLFFLEKIQIVKLVALQQSSLEKLPLVSSATRWRHTAGLCAGVSNCRGGLTLFRTASIPLTVVIRVLELLKRWSW